MYSRSMIRKMKSLACKDNQLTFTNFVLHKVFSQRSLLTFMATTGLLNAHVMRLSLNFIILTRNVNSEQFTQAQLLQHTRSTMMDGMLIVRFFQSDSMQANSWLMVTESLISWTFFVGYGLLYIPASCFGQRYGGKNIMNFGLLLSSLCMLLTPMTVKYGYDFGLLMLKLTMGLAEAFAFPATISLVSSWIPKGERCKVSSILFGGGQIGSLIFNFLPLFDKYPTICYVLGSIGILWNVTFQFSVYDRPSSHPRISSKEKDYLRNEIGDLATTKCFSQIPLAKMFTSSAVWGLILAHMGHDWGLFILSEIPIYFETILRLDYHKLVVYISSSLIVGFVCSISFGIAADYVNHKELVTLTGARQIFTGIAAIVCAIFTLAIYFAEYDTVTAVICLCLAKGSIGAFYSGAQANILDICPNYSAVLMGIVSGAGAVSGFLVSYTTSLFTMKDGKHWHWSPVFWTSSIVLSTSVICYKAWGSTKIHSWNDQVFRRWGASRTKYEGKTIT